MFPRGLTDDEIAILRPVYGDHLDYSAISINESSVIAFGGIPRTIDNTINIPGQSLDRKTLIHEAGHCWQYQHGIPVIAPSLIAQFHAWRTTGSRGAAYDWHGVESRGVPFGDWNPEQQATWIEDHETLPTDPFATSADSDPDATAPPREELPVGGTGDQ
jgi:hypothetical protein